MDVRQSSERARLDQQGDGAVLRETGRPLSGRHPRQRSHHPQHPQLLREPLYRVRGGWSLLLTTYF